MSIFIKPFFFQNFWKSNSNDVNGRWKCILCTFFLETISREDASQLQSSTKSSTKSSTNPETNNIKRKPVKGKITEIKILILSNEKLIIERFDKWPDLQLKCSTKNMFGSPNVRQSKCSTVQMFDSPNVRQSKCSTVQMFNSCKKSRNKRFVKQRVANKSNKNEHERNIENRLVQGFLTFFLLRRLLKVKKLFQ